MTMKLHLFDITRDKASLLSYLYVKSMISLVFEFSQPWGGMHSQASY